MSPEAARAWTPSRWIVVVASFAGILVGVWLLTHTWSGAGHSFEYRLNDTISIATEIAVLILACLIALRAGDQAANISLALSLTAVYGDGILVAARRVLLPASDVSARLVGYAGFLAGAYLFVRATQKFPRTITPGDLLASPTAWGRYPAPRFILTVLLRRIPLGVLIACLTAIAAVQPNLYLRELARTLVVVLGAVYFYISYRSGNAESRRKVLWFLAVTVGSLVIVLTGFAARAALAQANSETLQTIVSVTSNLLDSLISIACYIAAVFYAGAISPSLVIRKAVVYGAIVPLFLFGFAAVEAFFAEHVVAVLSITDHFASALIGGMFGLAFHPVKHRLEKLTERFSPNHHAPGSWSDSGHSHADHTRLGV